MRGDCRSRRIARRELLQALWRAGTCAPFAGAFSNTPALARARRQEPAPFTPLAGQPTFSQQDEALLQELENANFLYFWEQANPDTGLVRDRCNVVTPDKSNQLGSIAALGFGLTAICIGEKRGFVSYPEARGRVLNTLRFLWKKLPNHRGFFYHWANINTGERLWDSEVSSIDTAILLCGVLTCREYFQHSEITELGSSRSSIAWIGPGSRRIPRILPHGWTPETGFLQYRWDNYSEMMMMYLLGLGSFTYPLPATAWDAWKRDHLRI